MKVGKGTSLILGVAMVGLAAVGLTPAAGARSREEPAGQYVVARTGATKTPAKAVDELRWLEEPTAERAVAWARQATEASSERLRALKSYPEIVQDLRRTLETAPVVSDVLLLGPYGLRLHRDVKHPKGLLQRADRRGASLGAWVTVLDVGALSLAEHGDYDLRLTGEDCLPPTFDRCLLSFGIAGGDEALLREFDLAQGRFVDGGFSLPASRHVVAWLDRDQLIVGHDLAGAAKTTALWPAEARVWRRGSSLDSSVRVFSAPPKNVLFQLHSLGGQGRALLLEVIDFSTFALHVVDAGGKVRRLELPTKLKIFGFQGATARHVFVQLSEAATFGKTAVPAESILSYDLGVHASESASTSESVPVSAPASPSTFAPLSASTSTPAQPVQVVYTPAAGEVISSQGFGTTQTRVIFPVRSQMKLRLLEARLDHSSWRVSALARAPAGVELRVTGADPVGESIALSKEGFLVPPSVELLNADGSSVPIDHSPHVFDASKLRVDIRRARAADSETIDYYLIAPTNTGAARVPTLITAYGAFGVSMTPAYPTSEAGYMYGGATLKLWFDRGGALVVPAIRGGGERGSAWHQAAMREKRQISYDDLYAIATDIIRSGLTDKNHLGVFGTSNGGLLAAVAGLQRPDLFGAVVSDAPLTDMLRYVDMGIGAAWTGEYGDPRDLQAAAWLARYSPLHLVKPNTKYPPFLITVAATDNRVGPGHARKLAKRLMDVGSEAVFLEAQSGGHAVSDPYLQPDLMAMRAAFLLDKLH